MRPKRITASNENVLPTELRRSVPRPVSLTLGGRLAAAGCVLIVVGMTAVGAFLWTKLTADNALAAELARSGASADATVTSVRRTGGEDAHLDVRYVYVVQGVEYQGRGRLGKRSTVATGSQLKVGYLPLQPSRSWLEGRGPRPPLPVVAIVAPFTGFVIAAILVVIIRRQHRLLSDGRAAMARVTGVKKSGHGKETRWRVQYQWQLLNGATRTGHTDKASSPPAEGSFVPLLYDPENPKRYAAWPLSLVRLTRW